MITKKEVQKVAKLARLGLTEKEVVKYQKELSAILDYFEKLKKVDVSGIEPLSHPFLVENITRADIQNTKHKTQNTKLMDLAPETKQGYLKVNPVIQLPVRSAHNRRRRLEDDIRGKSVLK